MSGAISSLTPIPFPAGKRWITSGDWTAKYTQVKQGAKYKWLFVFGWDGYATRDGGYLWSPYTKRQIDLVSWSGDSDAVVEAAFTYAGCVFSPGVDCQGQDLTGVSKALTDSGLTLAGISMAGANLRTTNWSKVDMTKISLEDANLTYATMVGTNLTDAKLMRASLPGAVLVGANLTRADLTGANLTGAVLNGANLTGAIVTGATLTKVKTSSKTTCPDGTPGPCTGGAWPTPTPLVNPTP